MIVYFIIDDRLYIKSGSELRGRSIEWKLRQGPGANRGTLASGRWDGLLKKGGRGIDGLREGILEAS